MKIFIILLLFVSVAKLANAGNYNSGFERAERFNQRQQEQYNWQEQQRYNRVQNLRQQQQQNSNRYAPNNNHDRNTIQNFTRY